MSWSGFCCPVCKGTLVESATKFECEVCDGEFDIVEGVPDFFVPNAEHNFDTDANAIWLDPEIVEARNTVYRLCARELRGMAFCMKEIARRTGPGCRVLEVGVGTGHFTRWLAEVATPGTEIYAFDFSWPIIEKAGENVSGLSGIRLFRANARAALPFKSAEFDIVFTRLAPLGLPGVTSVQAGFDLLKAGGWYFNAGWEQPQYETLPVEWAMQHGYECAEHHVWRYWRVQTAQEHAAMQAERERLAAFGLGGEVQEQVLEDGSVRKMTEERLLMARKPV